MFDTVELSIINLCNLTCSFCPHAVDYPNDASQTMDDETLDVVVKHLKEIDRPFTLTLSGRGEPTLHPHFPDVVNKLRTVQNAFLRVVTNGARVKRHADTLQQFDEVFYNVYSDDDADFYEAVEVCKTNNIPTNPIMMKNHDGSRVLRYQNDRVHVDQMTITNRAGSVQTLTVVPGAGYCFRPFKKIFINWNGDYVLCCEDWTDKPISNVYDQSIVNYYSNNSTLQTIKADLDKGVRKDICKKCSFPG